MLFKAIVDACNHKDLEFLGSEKTDQGQNRYMKCKSCGSVIVVTAGGRVVSIAGVGSPRSKSAQENAGTHPE